MTDKIHTRDAARRQPDSLPAYTPLYDPASQAAARTDTPPPPPPMQDIQGRCPACGLATLLVGDGGYITCSNADCPRPDLVTELIGEIGDSRQHGAFVFCGHRIGYATMREFATKISEKRNALGQREEAVRYANEQKQRAEQLEELLAIAHETSSTAETERARLAAEVQRLGDWCRAVSERATTAEADRDRCHDELTVNETDRVAAAQRADRAEAAIARVRKAAAHSFMAGPNAVDVVRVADVLAALDEPKEG